MSKFSLIKQLQEAPEERKLPEGIEYAQFNVTVGKENITVNIPLREADEFKTRLDQKYTPRTFRTLMREFRGIRQN